MSEESYQTEKQQTTNFQELYERHLVRLELFRKEARDLAGLRMTEILPFAKGNDETAKLGCAAADKELESICKFEL